MNERFLKMMRFCRSVESPANGGPLRHPGGAVKCAVAAAVAAVERRSVSRGWMFFLLSRR
jgi:hypothetical protein